MGQSGSADRRSGSSALRNAQWGPQESKCLGIALPSKATTPLDFEKKVASRWSSVNADILRELTVRRKAAIEALAAAVAQSKNLNEVQQPDADDALENKLRPVHAYLGLLCGTVSPQPYDLDPAAYRDIGPIAGRDARLRKLCGFYWASCFGPTQSFVCEDTEYEAAAMIEALGIVELLHVKARLQASNRTSEERMEKSAYHLCRRAAGKFDCAAELMGEADVSTNDAVPADQQPAVLQGLRDLALGQAQELAMAMALRKETAPTEKADKWRQAAGLAAQAVALYAAATDSLKADADLLLWVETKREAMRARAFALKAEQLNLDVETVSQALRAAAASTEAAAKATKTAARFGPLLPVAQSVETEAQRVQHKVQRENELVSHMRPAEGEAPMPDAIVLANIERFQLPPPDVCWADGGAAKFVEVAPPKPAETVTQSKPADGEVGNDVGNEVVGNAGTGTMEGNNDVTAEDVPASKASVSGSPGTATE